MAEARRPDCRLVTITMENRDRLPDELTSDLRGNCRDALVKMLQERGEAYGAAIVGAE